MGEIIVNEKKLTVKESKQLEQLEGVIQENFLGFVAVGNALAEIREGRLYRNDEHRTFEGYCRELWEMSRPYADRLIGSAHVLENLTPIGGKKKGEPGFVLPANEAQARELSMLGVDEQQAVWQGILEDQEERIQDGQDVRITASYIKKNVREYLGEKIDGQGKPQKKKDGAEKDSADDEFLAAYNALAAEIKRNHANKWRKTSREHVFGKLSALLDLVGRAGHKELQNRGCSMELSNREKLAKKGFRLFRMRPKDLVVEEWNGGDSWLVSVRCESPIKMSDVFKELMEDPKNLRA